MLAFQSLFAAFDPKPLEPSPPGWTVCPSAFTKCTPGLPWLDQQVLPALLAPSLALESVAARIAAELTAVDVRRGAPRGRTLLCAHIRRGDFREECKQYDLERSGRSPRSWVVWHHRHGYGCWQAENELVLNLRDAARAHRQDVGRADAALAVYASIEDASALAAMPSRPRLDRERCVALPRRVRRARSPPATPPSSPPSSPRPSSGKTRSSSP